MDEIHLKAGEFFFGGGHQRIHTLLGSCVTVTLWHPRLHLGGMCHFVLPARPRLPGVDLDARYADEAFTLFDRSIARQGTRASDYQAKIFGGGNMFSRTFTAASADVGRQNIRAARELLAERNIGLVSEHVGGAGHRKLYFDIWSGDVWLSFQDIRQANYG
jgi:chemotaxis protein CheD